MRSTSVFVLGGELPLEANQDMMVASSVFDMMLSCEYVVDMLVVQWCQGRYGDDGE